MAYHEVKELKHQVKQYFEIYTHYPDLVQVSKAFATRENRNWLKKEALK
jgi:hypothetical protein